jgi:hypothetical protein
MGETDLTGKVLIGLGAVVLLSVVVGLCGGCGDSGVHYWEKPCEEVVKSLAQSPEGDGEHVWLRCEPIQRLELVVLHDEPLAVCRCPRDYLIDAGPPNAAAP